MYLQSLAADISPVRMTPAGFAAAARNRGCKCRPMAMPLALLARAVVEGAQRLLGIHPSGSRARRFGPCVCACNTKYIVGPCECLQPDALFELLVCFAVFASRTLAPPVMARIHLGALQMSAHVHLRGCYEGRRRPRLCIGHGYRVEYQLQGVEGTRVGLYVPLVATSAYGRIRT